MHTRSSAASVLGCLDILGSAGHFAGQRTCSKQNEAAANLVEEASTTFPDDSRDYDGSVLDLSRACTVGLQDRPNSRNAGVTEQGCAVEMLQTRLGTRSEDVTECSLLRARIGAGIQKMRSISENNVLTEEFA